MSKGEGEGEGEMRVGLWGSVPELVPSSFPSRITGGMPPPDRLMSTPPWLLSLGLKPSWLNDWLMTTGGTDVDERVVE